MPEEPHLTIAREKVPFQGSKRVELVGRLMLSKVLYIAASISVLLLLTSVEPAQALEESPKGKTEAQLDILLDMMEVDNESELHELEVHSEDNAVEVVVELVPSASVVNQAREVVERDGDVGASSTNCRAIRVGRATVNYRYVQDAEWCWSGGQVTTMNRPIDPHFTRLSNLYVDMGNRVSSMTRNHTETRGYFVAHANLVRSWSGNPAKSPKSRLTVQSGGGYSHNHWSH